MLNPDFHNSDDDGMKKNWNTAGLPKHALNRYENIALILSLGKKSLLARYSPIGRAAV